MKRPALLTLTITILLIGMQLRSQNLVPNHSFEIISTCPGSISMVNAASGWSQPSFGTSDLFHTCATDTMVRVPDTNLGFQFPRTGNSMAGFGAYVPGNYREYIQIQLINPLTAGVEYRLEFNLNISSYGSLSTSSVGAHFSTGPVTNFLTAILNLPPQVVNSSSTFITDTSSWYCVVGTFIATGGEDHITIGNFADDASSLFINHTNIHPFAGPYCYYFIDDICLLPTSEEPCHIILDHDGLLLYADERNKQVANLQWTAQSLPDGTHFRVNRSNDPSDMEVIKELSLLESSSLNGYAWTDLSPLPGVNWYQITQVNQDGSEVKSQVVRYQSGEQSPLIVQSWASNETLFINLSPEANLQSQLNLIDTQGRKVSQLNRAGRVDILEMPIQGLASGIYVLEVISNGKREVKKFMYLKR